MHDEKIVSHASLYKMKEGFIYSTSLSLAGNYEFTSLKVYFR